MATRKCNMDKEWQAESDAHTMAQYQEILNDPSRMKAAISKAKEQEENLSKRLNAMKAVTRLGKGKKKN